MEGPPKEDARDVLGKLIATMRYEYILAVRNEGHDSSLAKTVSAAIKAAYDQRAGMAYIRPATAYLATAMPQPHSNKIRALVGRICSSIES